jgi:hypothetical protein
MRALVTTRETLDLAMITASLLIGTTHGINQSLSGKASLLLAIS